MEDNLKKGDYIATGMGSWGFFKNLFKKSPLSKKQTENSNNNKQMPSMEEAKIQNSQINNKYVEPFIYDGLNDE